MEKKATGNKGAKVFIHMTCGRCLYQERLLPVFESLAESLFYRSWHFKLEHVFFPLGHSKRRPSTLHLSYVKDPSWLTSSSSSVWSAGFLVTLPA